ncbi:MAG: HIT family protein [Gemmataceae bacterium]|nr:HIT family protein [Gemmataceae bacterium]
MDCLFCRKLEAINELPPDEVVWQFTHSIAYLAPFQSYLGYCILASRKHATELSQLDDETRLYFLDEMCTLARAIEECFRPKKLNYEMLGNQTPHMHWHIIPRYPDDADAMHAIWYTIERLKDDKPARQRLKKGPQSNAETVAALRQALKSLAERE